MKVPEFVPRLNLLMLSIPAEMKDVIDEVQRVLDAQNNMLARMARTINGMIEFGNVTDEEANIRGQWVEVAIAAVDTATTFTHNMNIPISSAGLPNVRWLVFGFEHDGVGVTDGTATMSLNFEAGDTVGTNAIQLRLYADGSRTVGASNKVTVTLFFTPAIS